MKILYKYRAISNYTEKIFSDKKIWLSNAAGLNDPFECTIQEIAEDYIKEKVKEMKDAQISGFLMNSVMSLKSNPLIDGRTKREIKKVLNKLKKERSYNKKYKIVRDTIKERTGTSLVNPVNTFRNFDKQLQEAGIFSLSEDPLNELMWAHYANNSTGLAIGFQVTEDSLLANQEKCIKVNYSDELPAFDRRGFLTETTLTYGGQNTQKIAFNDPTLIKAISTKSTSWSYEKEWRYVEPKQGLYSFPGAVVQIIFGLKSNRDDIEKYMALIESNRSNMIEYFKIGKVKNKNKLELIKIKGSD